MFRTRLLALFSVGAVLAACSTTPSVSPAPSPGPKPPPSQIQVAPGPPKPPEIQPTPGLTGKQRMKLAIELLAKGDPSHARPEIAAFLREQPDNDLGKDLLAQIDQDPKVLLGERSFAYKIQPGETLSILAERYLGDRFKFYALARYNGLASPNQAEVGQTIQVPGVQRHVEPPPHRRERTRSDEEVIQQRVEPKEEPKIPPPPPGPVHNPAKASQLRGRALEAMNKGDIRAAVNLLKEASVLDPENPLIKKDLARAERIASGMGSH